MMFGYATRETKQLMPMPIQIAHTLSRRLSKVRKAGIIDYLRPDGKTQVTVRYENGKPIEIVKVLISTQHGPNIDSESVIKIGGWLGIVTAGAAWYASFAAVTNSTFGRTVLPVKPLHD